MSSYNNNMLMGSMISLDADVQTYSNDVTAAGGSLSLGELKATNKFVTNAKAFGIWGDIKDLCPFAGGYQGMLVKLKVHPNITGGFKNMNSTGTAVTSANYNASFGYVHSTGVVLKSRLTLSDLPYNNFCYQLIRPFDGVANNGGIASMGYAQTPLGLSSANSLGIAMRRSAPLLSPARITTEFGITQDQIVMPYEIGSFEGLYTINHYPVSGTRYTLNSYLNFSKVGLRDEDAGTTAWTTPGGEIAINSPSDLNAGAPTGIYCISAGLPVNKVEILTNLLITYHQDLGRNDLTISANSERMLVAGDSYTAGVGASGLGGYWYNQLASNYNVYFSWIGNDGVSGITLDDFNTQFDGGRFHYKDGFHKSSNINNNYVFVELGTNDLGAGVGAATTKARADALCTRFKLQGWKVIYVMPVQSINGNGTTYTTNYNSAIGAYITAITSDTRYFDGTLAIGVVRIDLIPELQNPNNTTYFSDGLHLTDAGYTIYANACSQVHIKSSHNSLSMIPVAGATLMDGFMSIEGANLSGKSLELPTTKNWTVQSGSFFNTGWRTKTVETNILSVATVDAENANGEVQLGLNTQNATPSLSGCVFRYLDNNNYMSMEIESYTNHTYSWRLKKKIAGVTTTLIDGVTAYDVAPLSVSFSGNNFSLKKWGSTVYTATDVNSLSSNTLVGIYCLTNSGGYVNTNVIFNDFSFKP